MTRLSEKRDVQEALVSHLIGIGWEYLPPRRRCRPPKSGRLGSLKAEENPRTSTDDRPTETLDI
jgi:hypothetical protein